MFGNFWCTGIHFLCLTGRTNILTTNGSVFLWDPERFVESAGLVSDGFGVLFLICSIKSGKSKVVHVWVPFLAQPVLRWFDSSQIFTHSCFAGDRWRSSNASSLAADSNTWTSTGGVVPAKGVILGIDGGNVEGTKEFWTISCSSCVWFPGSNIFIQLFGSSFWNSSITYSLVDRSKNQLVAWRTEVFFVNLMFSWPSPRANSLDCYSWMHSTKNMESAPNGWSFWWTLWYTSLRYKYPNLSKYSEFVCIKTRYLAVMTTEEVFSEVGLSDKAKDNRCPQSRGKWGLSPLISIGYLAPGWWW